MTAEASPLEQSGRGKSGVTWSRGGLEDGATCAAALARAAELESQA